MSEADEGKLNRYGLWRELVLKVCEEYDMSELEFAKCLRLMNYQAKDGKTDLESVKDWLEFFDFAQMFMNEHSIAKT